MPSRSQASDRACSISAHRPARLGQHRPQGHGRGRRVLLDQPLGLAEVELALVAGQRADARQQVRGGDAAAPQAQEPLQGERHGDDREQPGWRRRPTCARRPPTRSSPGRTSLGSVGRRGGVFALRLALGQGGGGRAGRSPPVVRRWRGLGRGSSAARGLAAAFVLAPGRGKAAQQTASVRPTPRVAAWRQKTAQRAGRLFAFIAWDSSDS